MDPNYAQEIKSVSWYLVEQPSMHNKNSWK